MISPYSQGNKNFQYLSRKRSDDIFSHYDFYHDIESNSEILFSNSRKLSAKYNNKKILIIGGGPSTNNFFDSKRDITRYDFLWSVNHFYLNRHLASLRVDLAMMMLEPNIFSTDFKKYYNKFAPTLGFELHNKWKNTIIPYDDCFVMQTRFYGILGACQRMIIFASYLGASEIHFVGLDGLSAIRKGMHSFQPGKNTLPSISDDEIYSYQYQELWKYLYRFKSQTKYKNLSRV